MHFRVRETTAALQSIVNEYKFCPSDIFNGHICIKHDKMSFYGLHYVYCHAHTLSAYSELSHGSLVWSLFTDPKLDL